jgi:hypothetical protein
MQTFEVSCGVGSAIGSDADSIGHTNALNSLVPTSGHPEMKVVMKLQSVYLNPFQPFPERDRDAPSEDHIRSAIEDNMSRSVFAALANAEHPVAMARFLRFLAQHGTPVLLARTEALADLLQTSDPDTVEFGLQTWPGISDCASESILLVGISSSHDSTWSHDNRHSPENPRPDAWIRVPGKLLVVFECKSDAYALDATQISAYAHALGLFKEDDHVPCAKPKCTLASAAEAQAVKSACADLVLDTPWSTVADALQDIHLAECVDGRGRWLCGQAAAYVRWHIRPPYRGVRTVLDWLKGPNSSDHCQHIRRLVEAMGEELRRSAQGSPDAITFAAQSENGRAKVAGGAIAAVYVKLMRNQKLLQIEWLGRQVEAELWFQFAEAETERIGLEFYMQARGSQAHGGGDPIVAWNQAQERHVDCITPFENLVAEWIQTAPPDSRLTVSSVGFRGSKKNWHGGGIAAGDEGEGSCSPSTTPQDALEFLQEHREKLWCFPRVGPGDAATLEDAAKHVRKPALALSIPLDVGALASCGDDGQALQTFFQKALATIIPDGLTVAGLDIPS